MTDNENKKLTGAEALEQASQNTDGNTGLIRELWEFMKHRKKYWLAPIVVMLLLLSILIVFTESSALAPFIYALF